MRQLPELSVFARLSSSVNLSEYGLQGIMLFLLFKLCFRYLNVTKKSIITGQYPCSVPKTMKWEPKFKPQSVH